ncbi:metal-dependent transcriptional regulator [Lactiplantibacillus sp. WILCCON 0030]|uniref:Metal-dependent transcriptional regulator n=1 Tax=Lactiplantibacillus brownii TaxID=3069269 RepID=A0ABU1A6T7_9LACO|nr:metal-dependent transcriptional regulator [Lactiplantibacillus brownii]MDQ7936666.1 metal-dependent transcriptional regulator [Lactiplantibacillus brownii]
MRDSFSNYLKTIYEASFTKEHTTNKQIATLMGVLPGSVTEAVGNLVIAGYVTRQKYHGISLTTAGYQQVCQLMYRYRLCEVWLAKIIQLPLPVIPEQAWLMAAIDNPELLRQLDIQLNHPQRSPFGGQLNIQANQPGPAWHSLETITSGQTIMIESYLETVSTIRYCQHSQIASQQIFTCVGKANDIAIITLLDSQQREVLINTAVARHLYVSKVEQ